MEKRNTVNMLTFVYFNSKKLHETKLCLPFSESSYVTYNVNKNK